jgi:uncharacterized membrane protein YtjA (UPF0391 family)
MLSQSPRAIGAANIACAKESTMNFGNLLHWAIIFLIIALVAGVLGFGGLAGTAMGAAHLVFYVAIVLLVISLIFGLMRRGV